MRARGFSQPVRRRMILLAAATLVVLGGAACSKDVSYAYVDVHVKIDPATVTPAQLALITNCEAQIVAENVNESVSLRCRENRVPYDVGTFEWTTDRTGGTLQVVVRVLSANLVLVGETTSAPISVSPGKRTKVELLVIGVGPSSGVDAGTDVGAPQSDAAATDAAIERAPDAESAVDAPSEQPATADGATGDRPPDAVTDASSG